VQDPHTLVGQVLADTYQIEALLATGGMGSVYRGRHLRTGGLCALKLLLPEAARNEELYSRFLDEARIVAALRHPHIVQVSDFNYTKDRAPFLVMELLEGEDLEERLRREGRLALPQVLKIARQVGSAIQAAHDRGVVHRDLKPRNIYLARHPRGGTHVKVIDFGVSKIPRPAERATQEMIVLGTPQYSAPEVALGQNSEIDGRADQYALAAILYRCLCGRLPLEQGAGEDLLSFLQRIGTAVPPPLGPSVPGLPVHVDLAIARGLSRRKEARFPTILDFVQALEETPAAASSLRDTLGTGTPAAPRKTLVQPRALDPRRILAASLIGAVLAGGALWLWQRGRVKPGAGAQAAQLPPEVERFRADLGSGKVKEALLRYRALPEKDAARQALKAEAMQAQERWSEGLLTEAEAAHSKGQCQGVWQRASEVLSLDPENQQALRIKWKDCGVVALQVTGSFAYRQAGYPPLRLLDDTGGSGPGSDDRPPEAEQVLRQAQRLHALGKYGQAITLAHSTVGLDRLNYMQAYRIIGASACALGKGDLARYAHEHLDPPSRDFLAWACPQGVLPR
jgi:hypothetical protein